MFDTAFLRGPVTNHFHRFKNSIITDRGSIIAAYKDVISTLTDNTALEAKRDMLQNECEILIELMRKMVQLNARTAQDQTDYQQRYNMKVERYDTAKTRLDEVDETITSRNAKRLELGRFLRLLKKKDDLLTEFDEDIWLTIVQQMKVHSATELTFVLKDGMELPWII
jgi:site-specific DNA recombinase